MIEFELGFFCFVGGFVQKLFGTDGIRGKANFFPMTPEIALKVGMAVAKIFMEKNHKHDCRIVIGKDTRLSGYMLENALTAGILSQGVRVFLVGPIPTPAIAHLAKSLNCDAGIMLTASHNPAEDNGIKIFGSDGFKLSDALEHEIERMVFENHFVEGKSIGKAHRIEDAKGRYIEFVKNSIQNFSLSGLKIVLDCANGSAYQAAPWVFSELGAEVVALNDKPDGLNINLDCGALFPEKLAKKVLELKADFGIAFDGDADRAIFVDNNGDIVDGDKIMALCALELKKQNRLNKNTVVATVMSNFGFEASLKEKGIAVLRAQVGDRNVIEEMQKHGLNFGGEQSGHIIFLDYSTTGDGIVAGLQVAKILKQSNKKFSELSKVFETVPQVLINVKVKEKKPFNELKNVSEKVIEIEKKLKGTGRVLVRYSGTENLARVMVEGKNEKDVKKFAEEIAAEIKKQVGA